MHIGSDFSGKVCYLFLNHKAFETNWLLKTEHLELYTIGDIQNPIKLKANFLRRSCCFFCLLDLENEDSLKNLVETFNDLKILICDNKIKSPCLICTSGAFVFKLFVRELGQRIAGESNKW
ncbi:hypothetical protein BpHYR1_033544 [Brachionus plicatilis]|uniref:Uncharacterized protein n=1 Tax=Brachionus plicatilis TaxID=10195 RepID=A0A3M7T2Q2_BRAPC|nr:hypothetical protein BpHYR1_033544 [Brachionus plicatilis]